MTRRLVALLFMLGAAFVRATSPAGAGEAPCEFDSRTGELLVGPLEHGRIVVRLRGRDILIDRRPCGATVTNTDSIRIVGSNVATFFQGGLLEPGRTLEPDGSSEIEIDLRDLRGTFWTRMPAGDDRVVSGSRGTDLNGDGDVDLVRGSIRGMSFVMRGGSDVVSTVGGHGTGSAVPSIPVRVDAGPGRDRVEFGAGQDAALFGGRGDDHVSSSDAAFGFLVGGAGDDVLVGGSGDESIYPGFGADIVRAMGGDDLVSQLEKGDASDVFSGGAGSDEFVYGGDQVFGRYSVSLDGRANDGEPGEGDDVASDFERVRGSRGPDTLVGDDHKDTFFGGRGDDDITGAGGRDRLFGGPGDDVFHTADGRVDRIWGGKQEDTATDRDETDRVRDVEIL